MKEDLLRELEDYLERRGFGKNWDGAYQDSIPTVREFFEGHGFRTRVVREWDSESGESELVATKDCLVVRIPWTEDYNDRSLIDFREMEIESRALFMMRMSLASRNVLGCPLARD